MRAIWFILKLPLKILMAPVILSLTLFVWICVGIVYVSGLVLGLISMVVGECQKSCVFGSPCFPG